MTGNGSTIFDLFSGASGLLVQFDNSGLSGCRSASNLPQLTLVDFPALGNGDVEREPRTHITALRNNANDSLHRIHAITAEYSLLSFSAIFPPAWRFTKRLARLPAAPDVENTKGQNEP